MTIKPFTRARECDASKKLDEERKASLERALKNAEKNTPFDEYGNYGENNPPLKTKGDKQ